MSTLLSLREVTKRYGRVHALDGATLEVGYGEVVGLVGDNGAGKSTIVKVTSGAMGFDSGAITFDGAERSWQSPHDALEAGIETLYQDGGLAPHLSVAANLFLGREIFKPGLRGRLGMMNRAEMERVAQSSLAEIGMSKLPLSMPIQNLSGGQRQAVAIARSVVWARKLIILDEPTNHLGVSECDEVLRLIDEVRQRGVSVIMISHTLPHVMQITDRVYVMRLGRVVSEYATREATMERLVGDMTGATSLEHSAGA